MTKFLYKIFNFINFYRLGSVGYARSKGVVIGEDCRIYIREWGSEPFLISIGNKVTVAAEVKFINHDGATWLVNDSSGKRYFSYKKIVVGDRVFIGMNTVILPGVVIGNNVVIGAGSVVTKALESGWVYGGVPAKKIKKFEEYKKKIKETCFKDGDFKGDNYKVKIENFINKIE